jgi:hypothetical protein
MARRFYTGPSYCAWLKQTALKDYPKPLPKFKSFVLEGSEDCPTLAIVYRDSNPRHNATPLHLFIFTENTL